MKETEIIKDKNKIEKEASLIFEQGLAEGKQEKYDDALKCFNEVLEMVSDGHLRVRALLNKGWALEWLNKSSEEKIQCFQEALN